MTSYRKKHSIVQARQHEGAKIVVMSDAKGNQGAVDGDYLVSDPNAQRPGGKGSVYVVPKAEFEREHQEIPTVARAAERLDYPDYISHKEVSAVRIELIDKRDDGGLTLHLVSGFEDVVVSAEDRKGRPSPEAGWYLIIYSEGYMSFSPAKAFEEGYTLNNAIG